MVGMIIQPRQAGRGVVIQSRSEKLRNRICLAERNLGPLAGHSAILGGGLAACLRGPAGLDPDGGAPGNSPNYRHPADRYAFAANADATPHADAVAYNPADCHAFAAIADAIPHAEAVTYGPADRHAFAAIADAIPHAGAVAGLVLGMV